mmetsp:Transcript_7063/g.23188  ORF Transcript_7063/g.23188 Transcript_7063/m.23188 type:complete len:100 (-) Transcript_7063:402-701(-)
MAPVRFFLLCVGMLTAQAFLTAPRQQPRVTARHGFFEDMMGAPFATPFRRCLDSARRQARREGQEEGRRRLEGRDVQGTARDPEAAAQEWYVGPRRCSS